MSRFLVRRLGAGVIQVIAVTLLAWILFFVIARFTGASPAVRIAGRNPSPARVAEVAKRIGADRPYWRQYLSFLSGVLHGDFGYSFDQGRSVSSIIFPAAAATASLVIGAAVLWMLIAIPLGAYGALHPRSTGDVAVRVVAVIGMSIPIFWVAPMFSYLFAYQPTQGLLFGFKV